MIVVEELIAVHDLDDNDCPVAPDFIERLLFD